jgi:hypothetical protein
MTLPITTFGFAMVLRRENWVFRSKLCCGKSCLADGQRRKPIEEDLHLDENDRRPCARFPYREREWVQMRAYMVAAACNLFHIARPALALT